MAKQHPITYEHIGWLLAGIAVIFIAGSAVLYWAPEQGAKIPKELDDGTTDRIIWEANHEDQTPTIGYMECFNDDGTGPTYLCGNQEIRCYSWRGGIKMTCPTFENLYLK